MFRYEGAEILGCIFDVDDTLLDNGSDPLYGLHERSRLAAVHEVGERHGLAALQALTLEANLAAFREAKAHTLDHTVWNILYRANLVASEELEPGNPLFQEIVARKNELHGVILLQEGTEVPGASRFVRTVAHNGLQGQLAVASTAVRRDIDIFFDKYRLHGYFPDDHIVSREVVTHPKPHPEAYNLAFATLGLPETARRHVAAFEDDPRGIMSAVAAGLLVCAITTRFDRDDLAALEVPPHVIADSFDEFEVLFGLQPAP